MPNLSDFAGATKVTARSAAAVVKKQQVDSYNAQKPTSTPGVTASQADVQRVLAKNYADNLSAAAKEVAAAKAAKEAAGENPSADLVASLQEKQIAYENAQKNAANSARIRATYSSLDNETKNLLNEYQKVYVASGAGKPVELDQLTGQIKIGAGELEKSAYARLTKPKDQGGAGLDPRSAVDQINHLKEQVQSTMSNTGLGGSFDVNGKFIPPTPGTESDTKNANRITAEKLKEEIAALAPEKLQTLPGQSIESVAAMRDMQANQRNAKIEQLKQLSEKMLAEQKASVGSDVTDGTQKQSEDGTGNNGDQATPDTSTPEGVLAGIKTSAEQAKNEAFSIADSNPLDVTERMNAAKAAKEAELSLGNEIYTLSADKAYELERLKLAENSRAEQLAGVEMAKAQLDQSKLNAENEIKARRKIAKLTGSYDMSGLSYVSKEVQNGVDALNYLRSKAAVMSGGFADKAIGIINQYGLDLRQADIDKKTNAMTAYNNYKTALDAISDDIRADTTSRREQKGRALEKYQDTLNKIDFQHADNLQQSRLKAMELSVQVAKMNQTQKINDVANAFKVLALATKKGVSISRDAMNAFEQLIAPNLKPGWMSMVKAGSGDGAYTEAEAMDTIQKWVAVDPEHRDITQLTPKKIALLVQMDRAQKQPEGPTKTGQPLPKGTPAGFGSAPTPALSGAAKEYRDFLAADPKNESISYNEFLNIRATYYNTRLINAARASADASAAGGVAASESDPTDSFINEAPTTNE